MYDRLLDLLSEGAMRQAVRSRMNTASARHAVARNLSGARLSPKEVEGQKRVAGRLARTIGHSSGSGPKSTRRNSRRMRALRKEIGGGASDETREKMRDTRGGSI